MSIRVNVRRRPDRHALQLAWTDPLTGNVRTRSAGTSRWKEAERAAARLEAELAQHHGLTATSWDVFRTRFEDEHLATLRPSSRQIYGHALDAFERAIGRPRDLHSITSSVLSRYSQSLRARNLSDASIATYLRHLRSALRWGERVGMISRVPSVKMPTTTKRGRALTFTEVLRFFAAIRHVVPQHNRDSVAGVAKLIWLGGFRINEAVRLEWDGPFSRIDIDSEIPTITLAGAGQKSRRDETWCIPPDLARYLRRIEHRTGRVQPLTVSLRHLKQFFTDVGRHAEIEVAPGKFATAHDLRRTFGHRWALRVHPLVLKHLMRHADISTTLKYYVDLDASEIGRSIWNSTHLYTPLYTSGAPDSRQRPHDARKPK